MDKQIQKIYEVIKPENIKLIGECGEDWEDICLIGDVLDWIEKLEDKSIYHYSYGKHGEELDVCTKWEDKRKPIEDQSQECKDFITSLIEKGEHEQL